MVNIGVTGHRVLAEVEKLQAGIDAALSQIEAVFPGQEWVLLSACAEGADRLVVRQAQPRQPFAGLIIPLPLAVEDYLQDFSSQESCREFQSLIKQARVIPPPAGVGRPAGYAASGKYIVEHSDVVIALWDGQASLGQGGTGEVVSLARQRRLPLIWVHCGNHLPGAIQPISLGEEQGLVSYEGI